MALTIDDGITVITLPDAMDWTDEYGYDNVKQDTQFLIGGGVVISENLVTSGRPITLEGGENVWISKTILDAIVLMRSVAEVSITLTLPDNRVFNVGFDLGSPIESKPIWRKNIQTNTDYYTLKIKFMEL